MAEGQREVKNEEVKAQWRWHAIEIRWFTYAIDMRELSLQKEGRLSKITVTHWHAGLRG